ncbi:Kinesin-like KIF20B [Leptosomus discolor]|uniref:Kinesin-like KIF20B n=1 Tax=Leptosomus discolor TaxID=188344 RepID=A0A091PMW8_LEPDC|nr:Kinesin-like KIF20B [Leptosomus discolor]
MEQTLDNEKSFRPSYIASVEPHERTGPVDVDDIKTDLSDEFSLASSSSDTSQSKGHIQVCLRVRPLTSLEREKELQDCVSLEDSTSIILKPPKNSLNRLSEKTAGQMIQKFTFSQVFGPETTQEEFFEGTMKQPVQDFLDGYNRLIFTYGVTNAGKTYTFQGTEDDVGILPRTMDMLFKSIRGKLYTAMDLKPHRCRDYIKLTKEQVREEITIKNSMLRLTKECFTVKMQHEAISCSLNFLIIFLYLADLEELLKGSEQSSTTVKNYVKFSIWVSFFEIYNECFYDLLIPTSNDKKRKTLRLAQDIKGCSYVKDLQWVQISNSKEAFRLLKLGLKHQSIASTKLNTSSSRSHSIFTVKILKIEDSGAPRVMRVNELSLCDLAGSERCTKTRNEGDRLKESGNINTSLLILGKCINALKNCQQSKLQHHIPFRESKLTHFLQGFFTGKGKVYMVVNISQCASTYDETLNVLKFSAIAQKVLVMDTSVLPQDQSFFQTSARESSLLCTKVPVPRRSATILWDRSLEDVIEDNDEVEEEHNMSREESVQKHEETKVLIGKEEYMKLLNLIEVLKDKLITEKKNKLLLELKIRQEVAEEFTQYFVERETDFKECLSREQERLEEDSERRLEIFKELVNGYTENADKGNKLKDGPCNEEAGSLDEENDMGPGIIDFEGIIDSLQNDVMAIKKHAEETHRYIVSLEDPQEAIGWLEKQLGKTTTELAKTKEELTKKSSELIKTQEKLTQKTKAIIKRKLTKKDSDKVIESSQFKDCGETALEVGRKRCFENKPTVEEEPPTKKGTISTVTQQRQKRTEYVKTNTSESYAEILALKERTETLEGQLAALEEQCRREKSKKEELSGQITNLYLELSASEERASGLSEELQQCRADYQEIVSELAKQKTINRQQEEKIIQLNNEVEGAKRNIMDKEYKGKIKELECLLETYRAKDDSITKLEEILKEKEAIILNLESKTVALQEKCANSDKKKKELSDQEANLKEEVVQLMSSLENMKHSLQEKEKNEDKQIESIELLRKDLSESSALVQSLKKDLQRKEVEYTDLKEKFSDVKKQIQQVQKEVCTMQYEKKSLRNKVNELQKIKKQFSEELEFKERTILHLKKEQLNSEKLEEISKQYEKTHKDLCAKEKIIEDMRVTLEEQEQTQIEQDQVLEAKLEENNRLVWELEAWKQKYRELNNQSDSDWQEKMSKNEEKNINENEELIKLRKELKENEAKYQTDRKKWLEEKMGLLGQVKEAESHRNREMRKFAEDRERNVEQRTEIERLTAQLVEKDINLQKWREERDKLVEALEVQLKALASNTVQKDKEIAELKQAALKDSGKELKQHVNRESLQSLAEVHLPEEGQDKIDQSVNKEVYSLYLWKDHSEIVLDSSEVSTENGETSRFPKPEMEIQFTPLQPNKMEVKHQGSTLPITVKMLKPGKKRKSEEMDEDFVKSENKKNSKPAMTNSPSTNNKKMVWLYPVFEMSTTQSFRKEYPLRKQESTSSKKSAKKKDGTLQKIGDFLQSSPTVIHSKAKKLIATISSPMSAEPEKVKEKELKPKRAKRKLYSTDISCPLDISASSVKQKEKESHHLIIKRRLRSKQAK